jgi:hypothetical protein
VLHLFAYFIDLFACRVQLHGNNHGSILSLPFFVRAKLFFLKTLSQNKKPTRCEWVGSFFC